MKNSFTLLALLFSAFALRAQPTNYTATTANSTTPGMYNTLIGPSAGNTTMGGLGNSIIGYQAGVNNANGQYNNFIGYQAGYSNQSGFNNVYLGAKAGYQSDGGSNVFVGAFSGTANTYGYNNLFLGAQAGSSNSMGHNNCYLGNQAGMTNTTGIGNTVMGSRAGYNHTGSSNVLIGYGAGYGVQADNNTIIGAQAGRAASLTGGNNTFVGYQAGQNNTTGDYNVFLGQQAGLTNTTGASNLFMGSYAGASNNGSYNLFIGNGSGQNNTSGLGNTFIGDGSGYANATGQNNTYIGRGANFAGNGLGSNNTFIGFQTRTGGVNVDNATAIGVNAVVTQSNSVIIGALGAKVGIGNSAPNATLEITNASANQSGLRFTKLTSGSPASVTNATKFLTVNGSGDVVLASSNGSAREGVSESLWQRNGGYLQSTQNDAVIIGSNVARTPVGYKLFVEEGILTEKVKVAVKNTSEWSDYVFADTYHLKGLSEVEQYVKINKHLPGVPSAEEVVNQGIDVAKMDATLLEKIEELTLYSIQQEKKAENQQQAITKLQADNTELNTKVSQLEAMLKQLLEKK
ncbi:hypothetical protein GCM10027592_60510 [Spirosoma flavus]